MEYELEKMSGSKGSFMKKTEHVIKKVDEGSIAWEMEIEPGDILLKINGEEIEDIFDYQFMIQEEYIEVLVQKPDGEEWLLEIDKDEQEDLGIEFENGLMSEYRSCSNKCMFCFIDQMPPGMRETLYFKDDDSRLSFLQGNYITMTNMKQADIDRIEPGKWEFTFTAPEQLAGVVMTISDGQLTSNLGELSVDSKGGEYVPLPVVIAGGIDSLSGLSSDSFTEKDGVLTAKCEYAGSRCTVTIDKATGEILSFRSPSDKLAVYFSDISPYTEEVGLVE